MSKDPFSPVMRDLNSDKSQDLTEKLFVAMFIPCAVMLILLIPFQVIALYSYYRCEIQFVCKPEMP